jgi:hypothetical protein
MIHNFVEFRGICRKMITRKDLVLALRVLHEEDQITKMVTRAKRIDIHFVSDGRDGLLVIPNPNPNDKPNTNRKVSTTTKDIIADAAVGSGK